MATRSEPASPRRLQRAKEFGDRPSSQLASALTLGAGLCVLPSMLTWLWVYSSDQLRTTLRSTGLESASLVRASRFAIVDWARICIPFLAVVTITRLVLKIVETGGFGAKRWASFTGYRATFHGRLTRLFTRQGALEQICAIAIPLLIGSYCLISMRTHAQLVAATLGTFRGGIAVVLVSTKQLLWVAFAAWAGVGCLELALSYRFWLSRLMMSPEDRRLELKETEGDPLVRLHRSRIQHQMLLESSQWSMSEGTLVIQAAMQIAVVLHYDPTEISAPRLLGVGSADLAAMIVAEAHRFDVPVIEHPTLPQRVAGGNVGAPIEEALYAPIAEIMSQAGLVF